MSSGHRWGDGVPRLQPSPGYLLGVMVDEDSRRLERILSDRLARETGKPARVTVKDGYAYVQSGVGEIVRYRVDPEAYGNLATYEEDRSGVAFPDGLLIPDTEEGQRESGRGRRGGRTSSGR
jgi:hypothetical protein